MKSLTDMAVDLNISTAQVLTALRIVSARADVQEIADWAAKELEGYQENDELPAHRIWKLEIVGSLHNPMQGFLSEVDLGELAIAEKFRENATKFYCRQSIVDIEDSIANSEEDSFRVPMPNLATLINAGPKIEPCMALHARHSAVFSNAP